MRFIKLAKILRIYRLIAVVKMVKVFRNQKFVEYIIQKINVSPDTQTIFISLIRLVCLLHFIGCFWASIAVAFSFEERENWMKNHYSVDN